MFILMKVVLGIIVLALSVWVMWYIYEIVREIYLETVLRYEIKRDEAKVIEKEYVNVAQPNVALQIASKVCVLDWHAKHNVYIMYNGEKHCFDDADLYETVKVGDMIHIFIHNGYDKSGVLKHTYLSLEE